MYDIRVVMINAVLCLLIRSSLAGGNTYICQVCPSNSDSPLGSFNSGQCECNAGFTGANAGPCTNCIPGKYKDETGDAACSDCVTGKYSDKHASDRCTLCPEGKYSDKFASASDLCQLCPNQSTSPEGSSLITDCVCNMGWKGANGQSCVECPLNTYKSEKGDSACTKCSNFLHTLIPARTNVSDCKCNAGYSADPLMTPPSSSLICSGNCPCPIVVLGASSGMFHGQESNSYYRDDSNCNWVISAEAEILLSFAWFDIEANFDYVTINQCSTASCDSVNVLGVLTGKPSGALVEYISTSGFMQVLFTSDESNNDNGFRAKWKLLEPFENEPCIQCPIGSYWEDGICLPCLAGTNNSKGGAEKCKLCPEGEYTDKEGSITCLPCESHTVSTVLKKNCSTCLPQTYSTDRKTCRDCSSDEYMHSATRTCKKCTQTNETICTGCVCSIFRDALTGSNPIECDIASGLYLDGVTRVCELCPPNKNINNSPAHRSCDTVIPNAENKHAVWNPAIFNYECVAGYERNTTNICIPCARGWYKNRRDNSPCLKCLNRTTSRHTGSISTQDCMFCSRHERMLVDAISGEVSCTDCPTCEVLHETLHMRQNCLPCMLADYTASYRRENDQENAQNESTQCNALTCRALLRTDDMRNEITLFSPCYVRPTIKTWYLFNMASTIVSGDLTSETVEVGLGNFECIAMPWYTDSSNNDLSDHFFQTIQYVDLADFYFRSLGRQEYQAQRNSQLFIRNDDDNVNSLLQFDEMQRIVPKYRLEYGKLPQSTSVSHSPPPSQNNGTSECMARAGLKTRIIFNLSQFDGFEIQLSLFFLQNGIRYDLSPHDCLPQSLCSGMFVAEGRDIVLNNGMATADFQKLSRFYIRNLYFVVRRVVVPHTGEMPTIDIPFSVEVLDDNTVATAVLRLKSDGVATSGACNQNWQTLQGHRSKPTTIRNPLDFELLHGHFGPRMCTDVDYA